MPRLELPIPPPPETFTDESWIETDQRDRAFTVEQRFQIRYEQKFLCAACGTACRGEHFDEDILTIHHVVPISRGGSNERSNAIGLCPKPCHQIFDYLALQHDTSAFSVLEAMGKPYELMEERFQSAIPEETVDMAQQGHKYLRKGKKVKKPDEIKRHEERKKRNPDPRPPLPPLFQREIVNFRSISAAD